MAIRPLAGIKRLLVGSPISSAHAEHERLSRVTGLAVLSSDALSSVAYATEEILRVLMIGGAAALSLSTPVSLVIALLLLIVAFSYRQTIYAYPSGGGAYLVAKDNLGDTPALIAAAALLIDYTLTVAVSIAAGVAALTSAFPALHVSRVELSLAFMTILAIGNLRGLRESGRIFSVPTYFFIGGMIVMIAAGAWRFATGTVVPVASAASSLPVHPLGLFVILTAFANGCTAMTGVEAVSNGVPAFRKPESRNAAFTLVIMAVLAVTMFVGITLLAHLYRIVPSDTETVVSQIGARRVRRPRLAVLHDPGRDDADPRARGQHRIRRLSAPGVHRVARQVPAASVHEPGRSARLLERHRRAQRLRRRAAGDLRRRHARADSALHDRRVRVVHPVAVRDGAALEAHARGRAGGPARSSTALAPLLRQWSWWWSQAPRRQRAHGSSCC